MLENGIELGSPWPPTRRELPDARCLGKHVAPTSYRESRVLERLRRRCVLAADGKVLVRSEKCNEVRANSTDVAVTWGGGRALGAVLPLKLPATVRLEFVARGRVALYSFWVGES